MPEIFISDNGETSESVGFDGNTEAQRQEQAKAELVTEQFGTPQPLILGKFTSQEAVATAYQNLESEAGRLRAEIAALKAGSKTPDPASPAAGAGEAPPAAPPAAEAPQPADEPAPPVPAPAAPAPPAAPQSLPIEQQERIRSSVLSQAGGEEEFGKLATWATHNVPKERLDRFNNALLSGNEAEAMNALKAFQYDRMMAMGYEPPLLGGSAAPSAATASKPFASEAEVTRAMNDPRYMGPDSDPAYVDEVYRRIQASGLWN